MLRTICFKRIIGMLMVITIASSLLAIPGEKAYAKMPENNGTEVTSAEVQEAYRAMILMQDDAKEQWETLAEEGVEYAEIYAKFCEKWVPKSENDPFKKATDYDPKMETGKFWMLENCFVYIPNSLNAETRCMIFCAGGYDGWMLRQDYVQRYLKKMTPNAVMIFYKASFAYKRKELHENAVEILESVSAKYNWAPQDVVITGSSNGGYSALYVAANLMRDYMIRTEKVLILDMGFQWMETGLLIKEEEASPMLEAGTVVYAFSKHDNIYKTEGSRKWLSYGVETIEVMCKNYDHDAITKQAISNGTLSWAIGEREELDPELYTLRPAVLPGEE